MKRNSKVLLFCLSAVLAFIIMPISVMAADPDYVVRGGEKEDFVKNLPYKDITAYVKTQDIIDAAKGSKYTFETTGGSYLKYDPSYSAPGNTTDCCLYWDQVVDTVGPVDFGGYTITYKDVVRLSNGKTADLTIKATDIKGYLSGTGIPSDYKPCLSYTKTNGGDRPILTTIYAADISNAGLSLGYEIEISVTSGGSLVDCVLPLMAVDIDNPGLEYSKLGLDEYSKKHSGTDIRFLEAIELKSGILSKIYIPTGNNLSIDNYKLTATAYDNDASSNTGFATLIAGKGTRLRWEGTGCGTLLEFPDSKYIHEVTAEVKGTHPGGGEIITAVGENTKTTNNAENTHKSAFLIPQSENVTITVKPTDSTYEVEKIVYDGTEMDLSTMTPESDGSYKIEITSIDASHTIEASFKKAASTVTYETDGNGSVSKFSESVEYEHNPSGATATPNTNYHLKNWTVNKAVTLIDTTTIPAGGSITEEQIKNIKVTEDITLTAHFEKDLFTVTYTKDGEGSVGKSSESVEYEENPIGTTATPSTGHYFTNWTADKEITWSDGGTLKTIAAGDPITPEQITKIVVTENITLTAHFEKSPVVSYDTDGDGGGIGGGDEDESVPPGGTPHGGKTPRPKKGTHFIHWVADKDVELTDGTKIKKGDPIPDDKVSSIKVDGDLMLTAVFAPDPVTDPKPTVKSASTTEPTVASPKAAEAKVVNPPKTGDDFSIVKAIILMILGVGGLVATVIYQRKMN